MGKKKKWEKMPFLFLFFELFPAESCFWGLCFMETQNDTSGTK